MLFSIFFWMQIKNQTKPRQPLKTFKMVCLSRPYPFNFLKGVFHKFYWSILEYFVSYEDALFTWIYFIPQILFFVSNLFQ